MDNLEWLNYMESICKEFLSRKDLYMQLNFTSEQAVETLKEIDTIKQDLNELKTIKESNPNEALEAIYRIIAHTEYDNDSSYDCLKFENDCKLIEQYILKAQEQEKVLEIIKAKDVDMYSLRRCGPVEEYNTHFAIDEYQKLKQEEYDTLKEWLESDKTK